jgi:hypothetical protein
MDAARGDCKQAYVMGRRVYVRETKEVRACDLCP